MGFEMSFNAVYSMTRSNAVYSMTRSRVRW